MANDLPPTVGIDLGTTFSVVAHLDSTGRPCSIPNVEGDLLTPSVVLFDGSVITVGKEAVKAAAVEPEWIAAFVKRDMGNASYSRPIGGEYLPPEVIQSLILRKLKHDAEAKIGPFSQCVITVPAFFNEPRRKVTQDAGRLAGLDVIDIINEPTAAAIAYGVQAGFLDDRGEAKQSERVLVFDLGGGTFDVTLMEIGGANFTALATAGDVKLGGIDWDRRIVDHVAEQFQAKHHIDPRQQPSGLQRLLRDAEDAKRALSAREQMAITFEFGGHALRLPLTRPQFEEMTSDLLERTRFTTTSVLRDAGIKWADVTRLLLVGGSSRMPMVQRMLEKESGLKADRSLSADEAVAHGAAIYAGWLMKTGARHMQVQNVNGHNLGVLGKDPATGRPRTSVVIPRNTALPTTRSKQYATARPDQREVLVQVVEGGDQSGNNSTAVGRCIIRGLPADLPAATPVEVSFTYEANGRLTVRGCVPDHGVEATMTVDRATGLTDAKLLEWEQRLRDGLGLSRSSATDSTTTSHGMEAESAVSGASRVPASNGRGVPPPLPRSEPPPLPPPRKAPPPLPPRRKGPPPLPG